MVKQDYKMLTQLEQSFKYRTQLVDKRGNKKDVDETHCAWTVLYLNEERLLQYATKYVLFCIRK